MSVVSSGSGGGTVPPTPGRWSLNGPKRNLEILKGFKMYSLRRLGSRLRLMYFSWTL